jgi:hypothetical protein
MMFTQEIADRICERLSLGESLRSICRDAGMPNASTVLRWAEAEPFAQQYAQARARGYALLGDEIIDISDEEVTMVRRDKHAAKDDENPDAMVEVVFDAAAVARNRLRVDARKWMLSKMLPKVYGDKVALTGDGGGAILTELTVEYVRPNPTT